MQLTARTSMLVLIVASLVTFSAHAEKVSWRASGSVTSVLTNAQRLPFKASVGDRFVIEMALENDSSAVAGGSSVPSIASYDNIFSAVVLVGNNEMTIMPSKPWTTTLWNNFTGGALLFDYYSMPVVDMMTQWEARWAVQTQVTATSDPITSLLLLKTPPDPSAFQNRFMTLTPAGGSPYEPAIMASLDSITVVTASSTSSESDNSDSQSGGGVLDGLVVVALSVGWLAKLMSSRSKSRC